MTRIKRICTDLVARLRRVTSIFRLRRIKQKITSLPNKSTNDLFSPILTCASQFFLNFCIVTPPTLISLILPKATLYQSFHTFKICCSFSAVDPVCNASLLNAYSACNRSNAFFVTSSINDKAVASSAEHKVNAEANALTPTFFISFAETIFSLITIGMIKHIRKMPHQYTGNFCIEKWLVITATFIRI
jgi:hypothetical protein